MKSLEGKLAMVLISFGRGEEIRDSVNPLHLAMGYLLLGYWDISLILPFLS